MCNLRQDRSFRGIHHNASTDILLDPCDRTDADRELPRDPGGVRGRHGRCLLVARQRVFRADLESIGRQSGVRVLPKFDVESTKTVGLTNLIIAEACGRAATCSGTTRSSTRCGSRKGPASPRSGPAMPRDLPETFKAKDGTWYGFAARGRILIVNTKLVAEADRPRGSRTCSIQVEGQDRHRQAALRHDGHAGRLPVRRLGRGEGQGLFRDLKANGVQVFSGNKQVATAVGSGQIAFGLTDTDDAMGEIDAGSPGRDRLSRPPARRLGTLFIPNTLAIIKGASHPRRSRGPGRLFAQSRDRVGPGPRAQRPDPLVEEHQGRGPGRDAQDRPRHGGRLRGRRQDSGTRSPPSSPPSSRGD